MAAYVLPWAKGGETMIPILYKDDHIVVCVKPCGVISQDAGENSLPGLLRTQLDTEYIGVVHRLDREVGGVMVFALNRKAAADLSCGVQQHRFKKRYLAVLCGHPAEETAVLEDLLYHDRTKNKTYVVAKERKGVKQASLEYSLLEISPQHSLVQVLLHTGRTHQIRVQFASRKLPLAGDRKYGGSSGGMGLWSYKLVFPHPQTGEMVSVKTLPPAELPWSEFSVLRQE